MYRHFICWFLWKIMKILKCKSTNLDDAHTHTHAISKSSRGKKTKEKQLHGIFLCHWNQEKSKQYTLRTTYAITIRSMCIQNESACNLNICNVTSNNITIYASLTHPHTQNTILLIHTREKKKCVCDAWQHIYQTVVSVLT